MFCYFNLRSILLLCALMLGVGSVWGDSTYYLKRVTTIENDGKYVFMLDNMVLSNTVSNNALQATKTYKTTGLTGNEAYVWTIEIGSSKTYLRNLSNSSNSQYLKNASSTNISLNNKSNASNWAFNWQEDGTVRLENRDNSNRFLGRTTANSVAFKAYAQTNLDSYSWAFTVYKLESHESVTITSAKYATYCSINALNFSGTGIKAYKAKVENGTVKMTEIEDGIVPSNTGVILYKDVIEETTVQVPVTATNVTLADNELVGTTEKTLVNAMTDSKYNYIMQKSENDIVFKKAIDGAYMPANRAYLSTANESAARLNTTFDETTEITTTDISNYTDPKDTWYALDGRRIANGQRPTIKGIYIVNGRKVVIK